MPYKRQSAGALLREAQRFYDNPNFPLAEGARNIRGLAAAERWMGRTLQCIRHGARESDAQITGRFTLVKYGLCFVCASIPVVFPPGGKIAVGLVLGGLAFYLAEVQMVFLIPSMLDKVEHPFRRSRQLTVKAGGSLRVMAKVLRIAWSMVTGGFCRRGLRRSWCTGCIAVCLWYESVREA